MKMNGATFRGYRELCGASQSQAAESLGVALVTVKKWERGERAVPDLACSWILSCLEQHDALVDDMMDRVESSVPDGAAVALSYYRTQEQADIERADGMEPLPYTVFNAASRTVAEILLDSGTPVTFAYPDEEDVQRIEQV